MRTLYAWKDNNQFFLSAFQSAVVGNDGNSRRPANSFDDINKLYAEIARRSGAGVMPSVQLKWDEGSGPTDAKPGNDSGNGQANQS